MNLTTNTIGAHHLQSMREHGEDMLLINVLSEEQFGEGHIPGSENVPADHPHFVQEVAALAGSTDRHIVVYCGGGPESLNAARALTEAGFTHVDHFAGGMREWHRQKFAVETGIHSGSRR
jgi:rhodanese-related sulfurtransferase